MPRSKNNAPPSTNGFLNLYKPAGMTSMEAVRQVKRITCQRQKVGHGGTIDPLARGALPICFGQATRLMNHLVEGPKHYLVQIQLGATTTTYDAEGEIVKTRDIGNLTREMVEAMLQSFIGVIEQTPPMYSAIKVRGQRLYQLARAGIEVERKTRQVEVYNIRLLDFSPPALSLEVDSGKGVYIRSLAHDLGEALGCGGYVTDLERLSCGGFRSEEAITLEQLEQANASSPTGWQQHLYPVDWTLQHLQSISVGPQAEKYLRNGQAISLGRPVVGAGYLEQFRAYSIDGCFLALVRFDRSVNAWQPMKVFQLDSPSPYAPVTNQ